MERCTLFLAKRDGLFDTFRQKSVHRSTQLLKMAIFQNGGRSVSAALFEKKVCTAPPSCGFGPFFGGIFTFNWGVKKGAFLAVWRQIFAFGENNVPWTAKKWPFWHFFRFLRKQKVGGQSSLLYDVFGTFLAFWGKKK